MGVLDELSSQDRTIVEFHVSGLLEILAEKREKTIDEDARDDIDFNARYLIARFLPEKDRPRFNEIYEEYKGKANLRSLLVKWAETYRNVSRKGNVDDKEYLGEIDGEARHFIEEFLKINIERESFYDSYLELTGRKPRRINQCRQSGLCDSQTGSLQGR